LEEDGSPYLERKHHTCIRTKSFWPFITQQTEQRVYWSSFVSCHNSVTMPFKAVLAIRPAENGNVNYREQDMHVGNINVNINICPTPHKC
jgi:hypothetical protein